MRITLSLLCIFCFNLAFAQQPEVKIFPVNKVGGGALLYASNPAYCPVSITLLLTMSNLAFNKEDQKYLVVPATTDSFLLGEISMVEPGKKYKYSYRYTYGYGDFNQKNYDKDFEYQLPYQKGKSFLLDQGYNGIFSHQNENALDFTMPESTEILAARGGIVVRVVQNNTESCARKECMQYNNTVTIYHDDGTLATYAHIKYNGSKVKPGDRVLAGDLIALSGNTGWSSGPHLHFACFFHGLDRENSIVTKFKIKAGMPARLLTEKENYLKDY